MKIAGQLRAAQSSLFSFEFFPPKTDEGERELVRTIEELAALAPAFVSVTYGAGGSLRARTIEIATRIKRETGIEVMAHLACIGHCQAEIARILDRFEEAGIENVLCLRGDLPRDRPQDSLRADGFCYASDLVAFVRGGPWRFCLGGACYPEKHLESPSVEEDLWATKVKVGAGAEFLITQLFFDNTFYLRFLERARRVGITVPIIPGIMPITNVAQIARFAQMCGATIPGELREELEGCKDNPEAILEIGITHALAQCQELLSHGAPGIHFYTLNRSRATRRILETIRVQHPPSPGEA